MAPDTATPGETPGSTNASTASATPSGVELGPDGKPWDPARAGATIQELRGFEKTSKEQAKIIADLEKKLKAHEDEKLTETERLSTRLAELEAERSKWERERQELTVGLALRDAAARAGATHPDAIPRLVDLSAVVYDTDGQPKNLDKLVEQVKAAYPPLFQQQTPGSADGGARGSAPTASMDDWLRSKAGLQS